MDMNDKGINDKPVDYLHDNLPSVQVMPVADIQMGKPTLEQLSLLLVNKLLSQIPVLGSILTTLTTYFWPKNQADMWQQMKSKIEQSIDVKIANNNWQRLSLKLREIQEKFNTWQHYLETGKASQAVEIYHFISNYLIGMEENFKLYDANVKQRYIPLFVTFVEFVLCFRVDIINNYQKYHLAAKDAANEENLLKRLILGDKGAAKYVLNEANDYWFEFMDKIAKSKTKVGTSLRMDVEENKFVSEIFFLSSHGMAWERVEIWKQRATHPKNLKYIDLEHIIPAIIIGDLSRDDSDLNALYMDMKNKYAISKGYGYIKNVDIYTRVAKVGSFRNPAELEVLSTIHVKYYSGKETGSEGLRKGKDKPTLQLKNISKTNQIVSATQGWHSNYFNPIKLITSDKGIYRTYDRFGWNPSFHCSATAQNGYLLRAIHIKRDNHGKVKYMVYVFAFDNEGAKKINFSK